MCAIIAVVIAGLIVMLAKPTLFKCVKINEVQSTDVENGKERRWCRTPICSETVFIQTCAQKHELS